MCVCVRACKNEQVNVFVPKCTRARVRVLCVPWKEVLSSQHATLPLVGFLIMRCMPSALLLQAFEYMPSRFDLPKEADSKARVESEAKRMAVGVRSGR